MPVVTQTESFRTAQSAPAARFPARSRYPVSRPGHGTLFSGPVTGPCFSARSRYPLPPQVLDDLGNRLRAAAVYSGLYILTSNELYQVLDDLGNRLRAAAAAGDVELVERLVDEVCVWGGSV